MSKNNGNNGSSVNAVSMVSADEGFTKLTTDVDLYYSVQGPDGQPVAFRGIVLERRDRPVDHEGQTKSYFILRATRPFLVKNNDKQFVTCNVGDHIWVDERASYARIHAMLPRHTSEGTVVFEVIYTPTKKVSIGGGKTMWRGDLQFRTLAPGQHDLGGLGSLMPTAAVAQLPEYIASED